MVDRHIICREDSKYAKKIIQLTVMEILLFQVCFGPAHEQLFVGVAKLKVMMWWLVYLIKKR